MSGPDIDIISSSGNDKKRDWHRIGQSLYRCVIFGCYSPGVMAPIGQASAQVPQSMQMLGSIE